MSEELTLLVAKRGKLKSHLTRFHNFLDKFDIKGENLELEARLNKITDLWANFENIQDSIEEFDESEMQDFEREAFENIYFGAIARAKKLMLLTKSNCQIKNEVSETSVSATARVKLPTISLPEFSGCYSQWVHFYNSFNSLIHENTELNNVQRLHYLKSCLKDKAAESLQSLDITDDNCIIAWDMLKNRYQNKKLIIHSHIKAIFELTPAKSDSHISLRKISDNFTKNLRALTALEQPTDTWDTLLIYIVSSKLDPSSKLEWEKLTNKVDNPTVSDLLKFLSDRCQLLETSEISGKLQRSSNKSEGPKSFAHFNTQSVICNICKGPHKNYQCEKVLNLPVQDRINEIKRNKLCLNRLRPFYRNHICRVGGCSKCKRKHNSILHLNDSNESEEKNNIVANSKAEDSANLNLSDNNVTTHTSQTQTRQIILATAIVKICDANGKMVTCRALLDAGSQSNFITTELAERLNLELFNREIPITGVNNTQSKVYAKLNATITSNDEKYKSKQPFLIINKITEMLPQKSFPKIQIPNHVVLADENYNRSSSIDILLGANVFYRLLCSGQFSCGNFGPIFQNTLLGWIVSGTVLPYLPLSKTIKCNTSTCEESLSLQIEQFWKLENCKSTYSHSNTELECEKHFIKNFKRDSTGRFEVALPLLPNYVNLGDSQSNAIKRFASLERRLLQNSELREMYTTFMNEYVSLGHMSEVNLREDKPNTIKYYMPHHGVVRESNVTTKLRVVFNASAKTTTQISLNDVQRVGPVIQRDLFSILLKFRWHNYTITGDIQKMYRQINVVTSQRDLQRIVWRNHPNETLRHYRLNTVTYGTAAASFLAVRCLHELAYQSERIHPEASRAILNDFYMDDLVTGASTVEDAILLKNGIETVLKSGGFLMHKWYANDDKIIRENREINYEFTSSEDYATKTLGLSWDPSSDSFNYSVLIGSNKRFTKRMILSTIASIFDPLGLIEPVVLKAKLIIQKLWQAKVGWDESLPAELHNSWRHYHDHLLLIRSIRVPRQVVCCNCTHIEVHGFSDASVEAYGACLYLRSTSNNGTFVQLLCSKSRVAPLKTVSLPRLELCGAVLLSQLTKKALNSLSVEINDVFYWTDSSIVLSWIAAESNAWKTFVANRVAEIQKLTSKTQWRHVPSKQNPADIISRGANPQEFNGCTLWWHGSEFLLLDKSLWPDKNFVSIPETTERRRLTPLAFLNCTDHSIFEKFSSLIKLQRVFSYVLRLINNCKMRNSTNKLMGALTIIELERSLRALIKIAQNSEFSDEIRRLKLKKHVSKKSKLLSLNAFLDNEDLLRVGGRLRKLDVSYDTKHQLILPERHKLTELIIKREHLRHLHAGPQMLLAALTNTFWVINGLSSVKTVLRRCVICFKSKPTSVAYRMGDLPYTRVNPCRPFSSVGIDFAGPFYIKDGKLKNKKIIKAYLCVFVCFVTRAVHLELCGDLSADAFLNAFKRFISRPGISTNVYTDNGRNFVGANNELQKILKTLLNKAEPTLYEFFSANSINWHFIPPYSPHFGGLWEAAIKLAKFHIARVIGNANLNYECFSIVLCQIETTLNSRPLTQMSSDPSI